jgi:hypothetical protein
MSQVNIKPWVSASEVLYAINDIAEEVERFRRLPEETLEGYSIIAAISDREFKNLFLKMLEERRPKEYPKFLHYLDRMAENGRKYTREYRAQMRMMSAKVGMMYHLYGGDLPLKKKETATH